tara:strand:- start:151 stop:1218 length:1068 start_codon:yes stop_codon:yes gene_type:complete
MNFQINKSQKVLVTGATGFVAGWIIKQLVEAGVCVHATVRDPNDEKKVAHLQEMSKKGPGKVILFQANLLEPGSFDDSIAGCSIVFHTASPFLLKFNDAQKDFINPAMQGTQNILETVNSVSSVERVVLTSSCAAIYGDADECELAPNGMLNEDIWNTTSSVAHQPYSYSKTVAERKAWQMADAQDRWSLVVINPSLVLGPSVSGQSTSGSHDMCLQLGDGTMKAGAPPFEVGMVDVRDVADAHVRAGYIANADGRHIVSKETCSPIMLSEMLKKQYGQDYPLPEKELPKWLVWLVGPMIEKNITRKVISKNMKHKWLADNAKSKQKLGIEYRSLEISINEMFQQMIDQGAFERN